MCNIGAKYFIILNKLYGKKYINNVSIDEIYIDQLKLNFIFFFLLDF